MNQQELHDKILELVKEYCQEFHKQDKPFRAGDRISYASRVYDAEEMTNLVTSMSLKKILPNIGALNFVRLSIPVRRQI